MGRQNLAQLPGNGIAGFRCFAALIGTCYRVSAPLGYRQLIRGQQSPQPAFVRCQWHLAKSIRAKSSQVKSNVAQTFVYH